MKTPTLLTSTCIWKTTSAESRRSRTSIRIWRRSLASAGLKALPLSPLDAKQVTARRSAAGVHVSHPWLPKNFLECSIAIRILNAPFAEPFAIFSEGFECQRLSSIFLGNTAVARERSASFGMDINRAGQGRHAEAIERVIFKQDQLLDPCADQPEAMPAGCPALGRFAVRGKPVHRSFHGVAHSLGDCARYRNNLQLRHADLAIVCFLGKAFWRIAWRPSIRFARANSLTPIRYRLLEISHRAPASPAEKLDPRPASGRVEEARYIRARRWPRKTAKTEGF